MIPSKLTPIKSILERFVNQWQDRPEMVGVYLAGSWAFGKGREDSDLDLRVVLSNDCPWSEKQSFMWEGKKVNAKATNGNNLTNGIIGQWKNYNRFDARCLWMSEILHDSEGRVAALKQEAGYWFERPFLPASTDELTMFHYNILSMFHELEKKPFAGVSFSYDYIQFIELLRTAYNRRFGLEQTPGLKFLEKMEDPEFCSLYAVNELPHPEFRPLLYDALLALKHWDDGASVNTLMNFVISFFNKINIKHFVLQSNEKVF